MASWLSFLCTLSLQKGFLANFELFFGSVFIFCFYYYTSIRSFHGVQEFSSWKVVTEGGFNAARVLCVLEIPDFIYNKRIFGVPCVLLTGLTCA